MERGASSDQHWIYCVIGLRHGIRCVGRTGKGKESLVISVLRYIAVILPLAFILSRILGAAGVWHAFWITEVVVAGISYVICKKKYFSNKNTCNYMLLGM